MKILNKLIGTVICLGLITPVYATNPASTDYVDLQISNLQTQINHLPGATVYTAGSGISISDNVISNTSPGTTIGYAEFTQLTQGSNASVVPGAGFTFNTTVTDTIGVGLSTVLGGQGTLFLLPVGTYVIDYEMSLSTSAAIALYTGLTSGSLAIDNNTIAGSTTAVTWVHGRAIEKADTPLFFDVSPDSATAAVILAGSSPAYMVRLTILKIA